MLLLLLLLFHYWKVDDKWSYEIDEMNPDLALCNPIEHHSCIPTLKTLGSMDCPSGHSTVALNQMRKQGQAWVDAEQESTLSHQNVWFMALSKIWSRLG